MTARVLLVSAVVVAFSCGRTGELPDGGSASGGGSAATGGASGGGIGGGVTGGGSSTGGGTTGGGAATGGGTTGGGAATGGGTTGGGSATGGGATGGGAATGGGTTGGGGGGTGGGSATGGGGGASVQLCGGFAGLQCNPGQVCNYEDNMCGAADGSGSCESIPGACPANVDPTCGCDGNVYSNECVAHAAGTDANVNGGCTPPNGMFSCGWRFCQKGTTYCESTTGGAFGSPGQHLCKPLPMGCGSSPMCSCIPLTGGCQCAASGADLTVRCFAP